MDELREIADEHGLYIIEDSAQAIGAYYKGRPTGSLGDIAAFSPTGSLGDIAAFSLYATKNITSGEGGLVVTSDDELAEKARLIRSHGEEARYYSKSYVKSSWSLYEVLLDLTKITVNREFFIQALKAEGVPVSITYPRVIYEHPFIKELKGQGRGCPWSCPYYGGKNVNYKNVRTPVAEDVARRCFSLYTDPLLTSEDIIAICITIEKILNFFSKK
ncbi:MAG: hypothetical protein B6U75_04835 [Desulfurococcales archaeon ex4484_217_1]|nr:MAG: hypothetical protein B6U75_04835 [Desulfurococcales archaeon ex4484_217_1]